MGNNYMMEARKQYFRYFRLLFIVLGILLAAAVAARIWVTNVNNRPRSNTEAPVERVYDYANILTADEEEMLRSQIAAAEKKLRMDIVLVTLNQPMEGEEAMYENGATSPRLERVMEAYADNFWDDNRFGYNKGFEGNGLILVDNVYEGQGYWHISTSGMAEDELSSYDIDGLLDELDRHYDAEKPYRGYSEFVDAVVYRFRMRYGVSLIWLFVIMVLPIVVSVCFFVKNMKQYKARDTAAANAYVIGGQPVINSQSDDLLRKSVTHRRIESSSGGHSGGHSGGGGHHHSRSGASHGGGGRRH